jgi:cytoplasmic iron level regulating protein YaaA (DUF328/UPF0246 family)
VRLVISPAKRMRVDDDTLDPALLTAPAMIDDAVALARWLAARDADYLRRLWACNDDILDENLRRLATLPADVRDASTPAVLSFDGIQYRSMAPAVFERGQFEYVQEHLRILSGLYGVLRPLDAVTPYRLEMGARLPRDVSGATVAAGAASAPGGGSASASGAARAQGLPGDAASLYAYWGARIHDEVFSGVADRTVVNLASQEYARCVSAFLAPGERLVTCAFYELEGDPHAPAGEPCALRVRATYAKMARGEMVRYAAEVGAATPDDLRGFDRMGYRLDQTLCDEATLAFVRSRVPGGAPTPTP